MSREFFLIALFSGVFITLVYSIVTTLPKYRFNKHWQVIFIVVGISALIVGEITGEFISHGFEIPEWGFSLIFAVFCLGAYFVGKILSWLFYKLKNHH